MTSRTGEAPRPASSLLSPAEAADQFLGRLPRPCRLLVAFSGGGDSTGLLAALAQAAEPHSGLSLHAATVDHGLRPGSADEARAAARFCARLGIPHTILTWQGDKPATGIQSRARAARYRLLAEGALRIGAHFIVTGHTADDQAETLAMRRLRAADAGEGMDEAVLVERRIWVLRPFLGVTRQAIRDYLAARGLGWSEDPSNDNPAFERVRIRQSAEAGAGPGRGAGEPVPYAAAARFIRDHVTLHAGLVASVDAACFDPADAAQRLALMTLAAVLGGREHLPGRATADRVFAVLETGAGARITASRVVFDRRKDRLFLCREARGLPDMTIPPGRSARWDGRFEIANAGALPARVVAGAGHADLPSLLASSDDGVLPRGVARLASATVPRLAGGEAGKIRLRPMLAPYEHFLPSRKLMLAESLAAVFGLEQFPALSLAPHVF